MLRRSAAHLAAPEPQIWPIESGFDAKICTFSLRITAYYSCLLHMLHITIFWFHMVGDEEDDDNGDDANERDEYGNAAE